MFQNYLTMKPPFSPGINTYSPGVKVVLSKKQTNRKPPLGYLIPGSVIA